MQLKNSKELEKNKSSLSFHFSIAILFASFVAILYCDQIYNYQNIAKLIINSWLSFSASICVGQYFLIMKIFKLKIERSINPFGVFEKAKELRKDHPVFYSIAYWNMINMSATLFGTVIYMLLTGGITF
jgi:hypothetical protein